MKVKCKIPVFTVKHILYVFVFMRMFSSGQYTIPVYPYLNVIDIWVALKIYSP